ASPDGDLYVTDDRGRIVEIGSDGAARIVAGSTPGFRDGDGLNARFRQPAGLAVVGPGRLVVADAGNFLVRSVAARGSFELRPPASPFIAPRFDIERFAMRPLLWPVAPMEGPHEVAGTLGEIRSTNGSARFHTGVDVRAEQGEAVYTVRDGVVSHPISTGAFGSLSEWLRVGPVAYVHIRAGRSRRSDMFDDQRFVPGYDETGKLVRLRVRRGARFAVGERIGTVNAFNHVHLNVGWPGEEQNPLGFRLMHFEDTIAPTIARRGVRLFDEDSQPLTERVRGRLLVSGRVRIIVDAWDRADGNRPSRRLGLHSLGYQVLARDGSSLPGFEAARETIRFDRLGADSGAASLIFAPGSGIPFYGQRVTRFLYVVTNTLQDGAAVEGFWDTSQLPPGDYTLRVHAADFRGNTANRDVAVMVVR
ncbi:MAG TPA: hypothetical protein VLD67_12215, partial [Vicinamibacterales bacterium]|nr:hypothetical protein [Vicinamibacterales bacterium]